MGASFRVLAPYVTLKVKDINGQDVVQGFYEGAVVSNPIEGDTLDKHVRTGLVEEVADAPAPEAAQDPPSDAPKGNASREEWAAYASSVGASEEDTRPVEDGGLKQTELRDKYGK